MSDRKGNREYAVSAVFIFLLAAVPIVITPFPPVTDLPQHLAQTFLAIRAAADPAGPYLILWGAPNTLIYAFLYPLAKLVPLEFLGRAVLLFMTAAWIFAIFAAAARKKRPVESALLASLLLFNAPFYWGFLNFMTGFPFFVAWFFITTREKTGPQWRTVPLLVLGSALLYGSHILWFVVGAVWLGLISLLRRLPFRELVVRAAALIPVGLASLYWFRKFAVYQNASGLNERPEWFVLPFEKLFSPWFKDQAFGGTTGIVETILFLLVLAWFVIALVSNRRDLRRRIDPDLLAAAALLFAISFFAPDAIKNTICFAGRWVAVCFIFLFLALPAPRLNPGIRRIFGGAAVFVFFLATTIQWIGFNRNEMTGFAESLDRIPRGALILELDYAKGSRYLNYRPFLQMYAYAQVFKDAKLAYPFSKHSTGLVAYREPYSPPWTSQLDWYPEWLQKTDLDYFDYVLVNGTSYHHNHRLPRLKLTPLTETGRWRLYRVEGTGRETGAE
jgi:hypothetical protein